MMRTGKLIAALAACALAPTVVGAAEAIRVDDAWARATPPGVENGAAYCKIVSAAGADRLTGARSAAARAVEVHTTRSANGVLEMHGVDSLPLAAGETVELAPGGTHLMLIGIAGPLVPGTTIEVTLVFEKAGEIRVTVPIIDARTAAPAPATHPHHAN